jgi:hypothetical protein
MGALPKNRELVGLKLIANARLVTSTTTNATNLRFANDDFDSFVECMFFIYAEDTSDPNVPTCSQCILVGEPSRSEALRLPPP